LRISHVAFAAVAWSVITRAEKRGEAGVRIEAWPTQPVERAIARDERGRLAIAD